MGDDADAVQLVAAVAAGGEHDVVDAHRRAGGLVDQRLTRGAATGGGVLPALHGLGVAGRDGLHLIGVDRCVELEHEWFSPGSRIRGVVLRDGSRRRPIGGIAAAVRG